MPVTAQEFHVEKARATTQDSGLAQELRVAQDALSACTASHRDCRLRMADDDSSSFELACCQIDHNNPLRFASHSQQVNVALHKPLKYDGGEEDSNHQTNESKHHEQDEGDWQQNDAAFASCAAHAAFDKPGPTTTIATTAETERVAAAVAASRRHSA